MIPHPAELLAARSVIIESGMALFAIQLVRIVLEFISVPAEQLPFFEAAYDIVVGINQMLNVIIYKICLFLLLCFADNIYLATRASHQR